MTEVKKVLLQDFARQSNKYVLGIIQSVEEPLRCLLCAVQKFY